MRSISELNVYKFRLSHKISTYFTWKPDPQSHEADVFQEYLADKFLYAFPLFV